MSYTCAFCGKVSKTMDNGWVPSFWASLPFDEAAELRMTTVEVFRPVCSSCVVKHLDFNDKSDDYDVKPGHEVPQSVTVAKLTDDRGNQCSVPCFVYRNVIRLSLPDECYVTLTLKDGELILEKDGEVFPDGDYIPL